MNIQTPKIWLPRTGQVTSFATGDDGDLQAGNPRGVSGGAIQATRFIDNLNGTISDRATGLQWVKEPQKIIPGASVSTLNQALVPHGSWATSHAYIIGDLVADADGSQSPALTIAGITKVALGVATVAAGHNLSSGQTIIITGCAGSASWIAMNGTARTVTVLTATTFTFGVNTTDYGDYDANSGTAKQVKFYVCSTAHTSGTFATDIAADKFRLTVWTASAANLTTPAKMTWASALTNSLALNYAGFSANWRVPNWLEMASLYDCSKIAAPLIDQTFFPNTLVGDYWSATHQPSSSTYAQYVGFASGYVGISAALKTDATLVVRPVRGGRINA